MYTNYTDISKWNTSNVVDMSHMFSSINNTQSCKFNQNINTTLVNPNTFFQEYVWDVHFVTSMNSMFRYAYNFDQNISNWDVSAVSDFRHMFEGCISFSYDIRNWDLNESLLPDISLIQIDSNNNSLSNSILNYMTFNMFLNSYLSNNFDKFDIVQYETGVQVSSNGNFTATYNNVIYNKDNVSWINSTPTIQFFSRSLPSPILYFPENSSIIDSFKLKIPNILNYGFQNVQSIILNVYQGSSIIESKIYSNSQLNYDNTDQVISLNITGGTYAEKSMLIEYTIQDNDNILRSAWNQNQDIIKVDKFTWDTSNVTNMKAMFEMQKASIHL